VDKYFTFFLCSSEWPQPERVLVFVDWLIQALPLKGKLSLIAREASHTHSRKPTIQGDYFRCRKILGELSLHTFLIGNRVWKKSTTELFVFFNRVHYTLAYAQDSLSSSSDAKLVKTEVPEAIKAFTVSIRLDIWKGSEKNGISAAIRKEMESLFVALNCISGYGNETPLPSAARPA
jgi:hypothetical protein